jgi:hypothetical protein
MSELKFSCPACGQGILCDPTDAGKQMACPGCQATITVPSERTSRLAIASLVCSLASLVICVGWLPGIICGHLAKSRIRRDPSLKGAGLARAGLTIGYLILMLEAGAATVWIWSFSAAVKHGIENVQNDLATNNLIVTQTQSTTVSNASQPVEPVKPEPVAAHNQQMEPATSGWTSDISKVSFPGHPASGKLHGIDFTLKTASFRNGDLKISSTNGMQLDVFRLGASIEGHSYEIQPDDAGSANPHIRMTWNEGGAIQTATFNKGYGMKLQFDQAKNRTVSGKIYLCIPDDSKSVVAGTFEVRLPKPK